MEINLIWGKVMRPWGFEVRVDLKDGDKIYNEVFIFPAEPSDEEIINKANERMNVLNVILSPPEPQYEITNADGSKTLI